MRVSDRILAMACRIPSRTATDDLVRDLSLDLHEAREALRLAYEFLDANYSTAAMPDILPVLRTALGIKS